MSVAYCVVVVDGGLGELAEVLFELLLTQVGLVFEVLPQLRVTQIKVQRAGLGFCIDRSQCCVLPTENFDGSVFHCPQR